MTTEEIIEKTDEERFADVLLTIKEGNGISNDDALFLVALIRGLDNSYSINSTVLSYLGRQLPEMSKALALYVLSRVGRTDQKTKRSVLKVVDQHVNTLWFEARQEAAAIALDLLDQKEQEGTEETQ